MVATKYVVKPVCVTLLKVPGEITIGFVYSRKENVGEAIVGYVTGIGFFRFLYKTTKPTKLKPTIRVVSNIASVTITVYSKKIGSVLDFLQIYRLEEIWFGTPVYIFYYNRL